MPGETLVDYRVHLADRPDLGEIDFGEGAALAVHDGITVRPSSLGHIDEILDG